MHTNRSDQEAQNALRWARMESLGQLAGGVAHDLNNLLTVIMNYSRFVATEVTDPQLRNDIEEIDRAARQAADLVHRLLVFARQEVVRAEVLDLNAVIRGLEGPLARTLGRDVTLRLDLADELGQIFADHGQVEHLIVTLILNAREALPDGGSAIIHTSEEGGTVWLAVEDDGVGMTADVASRAFEPFFTTKEPGEGAGMGLATVYGIVTGAGGQVDLQSEPGVGTVVRVGWPSTEPSPTEPGLEFRARPGGGTETVLVADDEQAVRETARRILADAGYQVLTASSGNEALELAEKTEASVHLLLTDLVMPRMGGSELARRIADIRPGIAVLYMSGYSRELFEGPGAGRSDITLLEKPFDGPALLGAVRAVLDRSEGNRRG